MPPTKADLEAQLAKYESIDKETLALQEVIDAIGSLITWPYSGPSDKDRQKMARVLAQAAQRFDLHVYSEE